MNNPINLQFFHGIEQFVFSDGLSTEFLPYVEATPSDVYTSNKIQIPEGYSGAATCTAGATFSINDGEYGTTGTIAAGDTVRVKAPASDEYETSVDYEFLIDAVVYDTWTITTMAESNWTDKKYFSDGNYWTD